MKLGLAARAATKLVGAVLVMWSSAAQASAVPPAPPSAIVALDRVTPVAMAGSDALVVRGAVRTSYDGATFSPVELFDLEAGGFVVGAASGGGVRLVPTGAAAPACAAAGVASPCLAPRVAELAHARLMTTGDFARSLDGAVTMDVVATPPVAAPMPRAAVVALGASAFAAIAAILAAGAAAFVRARRRTPIGQVYAAALAARKATRGDATLAGVRAQIDELVARANDLETARAACLARLAKIDRAALEAKRAAWAASPSPDAREPLDWITAELAEAARLGEDLASSVAGLERIAAALRVLALRARSHRGTRARAAVRDPVDALADELQRRDEAMAEAERAV